MSEIQYHFVVHDFVIGRDGIAEVVGGVRCAICDTPIQPRPFRGKWLRWRGEHCGNRVGVRVRVRQ